MSSTPPKQFKNKSMRSPHMNSPSSRTPSLQRTKSDPCVSGSGRVVPISLNHLQHHHHPHHHHHHHPQHTQLKMGKRVMTVPTNLTQYHNPTIVLELLLNLPMECHMGIGEGLKPLIAKAIAEQKEIEAAQAPHLIDERERDLFQQAEHQAQLPSQQAHAAAAHLLPLPTAPLAIPPTAPHLDRVRERDSLDEIIFDHRDRESREFEISRKPSTAQISRKASVKQFESVLQERYTRHLMLAVSQALFGAFLSGYNTSVLNTPSAIIQERCQLSPDQYASLQSFFCLGGLIGALSIGKVADAYGRKAAIFCYDVVFLISGAAVAGYAIAVDKSAANSWWCFAVARGLSGVGAGIATAIIPTYLGEISPPLIRGAIGTLNQLTVCTGLMAAELCGGVAIFVSASLWPWLFAVNLVLPLVQIATFWSFPESPKWLITQRREDEARRVLQKLRDCDDVELDLDFTKMANRYQAQARKRTQSVLSAVHTMHTVSEHDHLLPEALPQKYGAVAAVEIKDEVRNYNLGATATATATATVTATAAVVVVDSLSPDACTKELAQDHAHLRRVLAWSMGIAIGLQFLQQLSGINSVFYYSNPTLMAAGFVSEFQLWLGNVAIAFANFVSVFIPVYLMDKWGRKTLLNLSLIGMIIASVLLSASLLLSESAQFEQNQTMGFVSVFCLMFYVVSFEIGLGPIPWLMMAEITPSSHRAMIVSVATFFNWVSNLCIAQFANQIVSTAKFLPFAAVCCIGIVLVKKFVPETKGKTEMQIQQELVHG